MHLLQFENFSLISSKQDRMSCDSHHFAKDAGVLGTKLHKVDERKYHKSVASVKPNTHIKRNRIDESKFSKDFLMKDYRWAPFFATLFWASKKELKKKI